MVHESREADVLGWRCRIGIPQAVHEIGGGGKEEHSPRKPPVAPLGLRHQKSFPSNHHTASDRLATPKIQTPRSVLAKASNTTGCDADRSADKSATREM